MAKSTQKAQRKKQKQKSKREARKRELARRQTVDLATKLARTKAAPVLHSLVPEDIWERGMGQVLFSRQLPNQQVAFAVFLVDTFCLGVKDAHAGIVPRSNYEEQLLGPLQEQFEMWEESPAYVRKLVEGAVAYAQQFHLHPHADYRKAKAIFGDIDPADCDTDFEFGQDGQPLYINGPYESAEESVLILSNLEEHSGNHWSVLTAGGERVAGPLLESTADGEREDFDDGGGEEIAEEPAHERRWFWPTS